jgi:hypothetical protein
MATEQSTYGIIYGGRVVEALDHQVTFDDVDRVAHDMGAFKFYCYGENEQILAEDDFPYSGQVTVVRNDVAE